MSNKLVKYILLIVLLMSGVATSATVSLETADPSPPAAPVIIGLSAPTKDSAVLVWQPNREADVLGYYIFRSDDGSGVFHQVNEDVIPGDQTVFQDTGLVPGTTYAYFLVAVSEEGETGPPSETREVYVGPDVGINIIPGEAALLVGETVYQGVVLKAVNELEAASGLSVSIRLDDETAKHIDVSLYPGTPVILGSDRPVAMVRLGITARTTSLPGRYEAVLEVSGRDDSGIEIRRTETLYVTVVDVSGRQSAMVLGVRNHAGQVGKAVTFFGRLVPPPLSVRTKVSLRVRPGCGQEETIIPDIPVNKQGYFISDLVPDAEGMYCVSAFWDGDNAHDGSESSPVVVGIFKGKSRITCSSSMSFGDTEGDFFGVIHPTPPDRTPVSVELLFIADTGNLRFTHTITTETGTYDPGHHPGSFLVHVDLAALFPAEPVSGSWFVTAVWDGDAGKYQGARSETLYIPFMAPEPGRVVIVAAGDPEGAPEGWSIHAGMAEFALNTFLDRGFHRSWITYLSADPDDPMADGMATGDTVRDAVTNSGAAGSVPLIVYIAGPTTFHSETQKTEYILNSSGETLSGDQIRSALETLPPETGQIIFLDGDKTGFLIPEICREGEYRNILSFSGFGNTPIMFHGNVTLSRWFFTSLRQGRNLREAIVELYLMLASLRPSVTVPLPMADIGGLPGRPPVADCIPNERDELDPLALTYIGFGHKPGLESPVLAGVSEYQIGEKYAGETLESTPAGGGKMSDTTGGFVIWVHFDDPEEEMDGEPQYPLMVMIDPAGEVSEFTANDFNRRPEGGFFIELPPASFSAEGTYTFLLFQIDEKQNLSETASTAITIVNEPPEVLMFGYGRSSLGPAGGNLTVQAIIRDGNGAADIRDVSLTCEGTPLGIPLSPVSLNGAFGFYELDFDLTGYALDPSVMLLGLSVTDDSGVTVLSGNRLVVRR